MNLAEIKIKVTNLFQSSLARDTLWMLFSKLFNIVMQTAYFIIIARLLGKENYGSFVAIDATPVFAFFCSISWKYSLGSNFVDSRSRFNLLGFA